MIYFFSTALAALFMHIAVSVKRSTVSKNGSNKTSLIIGKRLDSRKGIVRFYIMLSFLSLFLVSALRWDVGTDFSIIYLNRFYAISNGIKVDWEPGYIFLNKLAAFLTKDPVGIFSLTSFIFLVFSYKAIWEISVAPALSIIFFVSTGFFLNSMNGIRQWITLAIFMYAIKYVSKREFKKYLALILVATTIHYSAVLFIPIYFFCRLKISPKRATIVLVISLTSLPFIRSAFNYIVSLTKYRWYLSSRYNRFDFSVTDFIVGALLILLGYFYYNRAQDDKYYSIMMNLQLAAFIVSIYSSVIILAERIVPCFTASQCLFIPLIISQEPNAKTRFLLSLSLVLGFAAISTYTYGHLGWSNILPYQTVFSRMM